MAQELTWYEGGKRMRQSVGKDAADALIQRDRKVAELEAASHGLIVQNGDPTKHLLADAAEAYLDDIKAHKSSKTLAAYTTAIRYFRESCKKTYVEGIDRRDLLAFKTYLANEKEQSDRSVWNKFSATMGFLKSVGHTGPQLVPSWQWASCPYRVHSLLAPWTCRLEPPVSCPWRLLEALASAQLVAWWFPQMKKRHSTRPTLSLRSGACGSWVSFRISPDEQTPTPMGSSTGLLREGNFGGIVPQNPSISNVGDFSHDALAAMRFAFALMAGMIPSRALH
jgi:hypothetical protein